MKIKAAILYELNTPLKVEEVELDGPKEGEVLVKLVGTCVCHTDISVAQGHLPAPTPIVLGHEGAGIVEQLGPQVSTLKPGDHVVLTGVASCGKCRNCVKGLRVMCEVFRPSLFQGILPGGQRRLSKDGQQLNHFFMQSSFAEYAVVPQEAAIKVRPDAPLQKLGLLGCGALTGIGSVINKAKVEVGASVAIFGCGGVGLSALMAARLVGAGKIIAVDTLDYKLKMAKELGASETINASRENVVERINQLTGGGADYTFVAVGSADVIVQAFDAIRPGGKCILAGATPVGTKVSLDALTLMREKTIMGCTMGSSRPTLDIPNYVELYMDGRLPIDRLVTRSYPLAEINSAFAVLEEGQVIKPVIVFD